MKTILCNLIIFVLLGHPNLSAQSIPEERWSLVQQYLEQQKGISGIVMMGQGGEIKINKGFGFADRQQQIPFDDQTLATIGSITKPFTASAILLLYEEGKINLSDPMASYLDGVPADKKHITLHHLLTHSSGLPGAIGDDYASTTDQSFLNEVWATELAFAPGENYMYSNVGYSLLGLIIEKVSGLSYSAFLEKHIFSPADMTTAGYKNPKAPYQRLAHGYTEDGADWGTSHTKNWNGDEPYWHLKANGGLLMSARDMYKWYLSLRDNLVLKPATLQLQIRPYVDEHMGGSFYGYGYAVDSDGTCVQHNGGNLIFKADFRWFPKSDMFLFASSNDAKVRMFRLCDEVIRILETGEVPDSKTWIPGDMNTFPANANERTAEAFHLMIRNFSTERAGDFITNHCSAGIIERNGRERLIEIFNMLHEDSGGQAFSSYQVSGDHIQLILPVAGQPAILKVNLKLLNHQLEGLGAEMEGH